MSQTISLKPNQWIIHFITLNNKNLYATYDPKQTTCGNIIKTFLRNYTSDKVRSNQFAFYSEDVKKCIDENEFKKSIAELGLSKISKIYIKKRSSPSDKLDQYITENEYGPYNGKALIEEYSKNPGTYQVFVKTLMGRCEAFEVLSSTMTGEFKAMVAEKLGIPPHFQRLIFYGKQLECERTFADYNIQKESTIQVVCTMRGGMYAESSGMDGGYSNLTDNVFHIPADIISKTS